MIGGRRPAYRKELFVLAAYLLAVYGMTHYLVHTDGPRKVFFRLRKFAGMKLATEIEGQLYFEEALSEEEKAAANWREVSDGSFWADVLECHKCTSIYVAAVLSPLIFLESPITTGILTVLAAVGATIFLHEITEKKC